MGSNFPIPRFKKKQLDVEVSPPANAPLSLTSISVPLGLKVKTHVHSRAYSNRVKKTWHVWTSDRQTESDAYEPTVLKKPSRLRRLKYRA